MARKMKSMDGNTAAAHVVVCVYRGCRHLPDHPVQPRWQTVVDQWSAAGQKNIFGTTVKVVEMQSEAGAAGTVHGSLAAGALTTTYTASQGLLLMIPNMYKIAGELLPVRIPRLRAYRRFPRAEHLRRPLRRYGLPSDRLCHARETNPQEVMDLSAVAHLAAIEGRVPFINFFDGFRTSHEIQKIAGLGLRGPEGNVRHGRC